MKESIANHKKGDALANRKIKKKELEEFFKCIQIIEKILTKFIQEILLQQ